MKILKNYNDANTLEIINENRLELSENSRNRNNSSIKKLLPLAIYFSNRIKYVKSHKGENKQLSKHFHVLFKLKKIQKLFFNKKNSKSSLNLLKIFRYKFLLKQAIFSYIKNTKKFKIKYEIPILNKAYKKINLLFKNIKLNILYILLFIKNKSFLEKEFKDKIYEYLKRSLIVLLLYSPPFLILAKTSIVSGITGNKDDLLVNGFFLKLFARIPGLFGIIDSDTFNFWLIYTYFIVFNTKYKELQIPYEIAYNGAVASTFLSFAYVVNLLIEYIFLPFDMYLAIKQFGDHLLFDSQFKLPNSEIETFLFDINVTKSLYTFLDKFDNVKFVISQYIITPLIFVTLCALVYNCLYYVLKKKNPQIVLISKTVSRTMIDNKDDLF